MQPPTDLLRQAAERRLVRAEQRIEPVVDAAVDAWVWALHDTLIRVAVRQHRSTAVTAAGNSRRRQRRRAARTMAHGRPLTPPTTPEQHTTVDAAVSAYNRWRHDLDNTILPTISITFGEAFQDLRRRTPGSDFRPQQEYMATVADRLRIWPDGAFDELRPELEEALSEAETIEQITDRVGRVLGIDAQTRALKAEINEVDAKLNDPQLHPWRRDALTARRRALWAAHDDAMQEWRWKARRIARTESHGAVQAGQLAAALQAQEETGETWYKRWLSTEDVRTRASHRVADGQMVPLTGQFRVGGFLLRHPGDPLVIAPHETINCFVSETPITAPGLQASIRAPYVGPLVTITMKSGGVLSGSPNHPILTERGWVRLGEIQQGDNLIRAQVSELDRSSRVDPHEQGAPTTIGEVHRALNQPTAVGRHRVARSVVDFYGDRPSGEVEVVPADRELRDRLDSAHAQHLSELGFQWRGPMLQPLPAPRAGFQLGFRTLDTTNRVVSGRGQSQPLILAGVRHAGEHGVAAVSGCDAGADQLSSNDGPADRVGQSERLLRLAGQVAANDALGVEHYASLLQRLADRYTQLSQSFTEGGLLDAVESGDVVEGDSLGELCHNGIHIDRDSSTAVLRHSPDRHTTVDEGLTDGAGTCPEVCGDSIHGLPISVPARNLGIIKREPLGASDVGWGAEPNTSTDEPITNGLPGYPELLTDIGGALAGLVEHDEVVGIDVCAFRGHLYTVQTESGIYAASSYIVRNCRCSCTFLDPDAAQEALQGPDGSLGEIRPGGVRLGTDDPTAAAEAIREVAETEQRALPPDPDARGEDAGQPSPAPTPPVDAPDEQPIAPQVTDMSGLTDSDLLELMQDANRVGDDELYDAAVAEWDARSALDHSREDDTETPSSLSEPAGGPVETDAQFAGLDDAELIAVMNDAINADDDDLYRAAAAEWARREGLTSAGRVPAAYGEPIRGGRSQIPQRGGDHPQRTTNRFMPSGTDLPDEYQDSDPSIFWSAYPPKVVD